MLTMSLPLWVVIIIAVVVAAVCFFLGVQYRKKVAEREIMSAEEEAKRIINESIKSAESKKREALVEAKEEIHKNRSEYERDIFVSSFSFCSIASSSLLDCVFAVGARLISSTSFV